MPERLGNYPICSSDFHCAAARLPPSRMYCAVNALAPHFLKYAKKNQCGWISKPAKFEKLFDSLHTFYSEQPHALWFLNGHVFVTLTGLQTKRVIALLDPRYSRFFPYIESTNYLCVQSILRIWSSAFLRRKLLKVQHALTCMIIELVHYNYLLIIEYLQGKRAWTQSVKQGIDIPVFRENYCMDNVDGEDYLNSSLWVVSWLSPKYYSHN